MAIAGATKTAQHEVARTLGRSQREPKDWLRPDRPAPTKCDSLLRSLQKGGQLDVHGMAKIAFDDRNVYVNGKNTPFRRMFKGLLAHVCTA